MFQEKAVGVSCELVIEGMPFSRYTYVLTENFLVFLLVAWFKRPCAQLTAARLIPDRTEPWKRCLQQKGVPAW